MGIACLLSFAWRISQINETDMGFQRYPHLTIPTLGLHLALSLSSLEFKIPNQRIKEGSRIWPEYRLHSIVFACRSIFAIALYWYEQQFHTAGEEPMYAISAIIVLATMAAADLSTASQSRHASKSIRDLDISRVTSYFFSVCQFYATAGVLFGLRRSTIQFLNVFVVQLNPFLMTLRRKNLISHKATVTIYGLMLVFGVLTVGNEYMRYGSAMLRTISCVGNIAILWRMVPLGHVLPSSVARILQNKYLIWSALAVAVNYYLRPLAYQEVSMQRHLAYSCGMIAVFVNGYYKCRADSYSHGCENEVDDKKLNVKVA